jgi:hypothetical protein
MPNILSFSLCHFGDTWVPVHILEFFEFSIDSINGGQSRRILDSISINLMLFTDGCVSKDALLHLLPQLGVLESSLHLLRLLLEANGDLVQP